MKIAISAGHWQKARGACDGDMCEFPLTLTWAERIADNLIRLGHNAVIVPSGTLPNKVTWINYQAKAACAVEVHFNSSQSGTAIGSETLYDPLGEEGQALAVSIQRRLGAVSLPNRGAVKGYYQRDPLKGADYFLHATRCPAAIVEPLFIQQTAELSTLMGPCTEAIALGIHEWASVASRKAS